MGLVLKGDLVPEVECGQPGMGHGKGVSIIFLLWGIHGWFRCMRGGGVGEPFRDCGEKGLLVC